MNPSKEEVLEVAVPALVAAFARHMDKRAKSDWEPLSYILAEEAGVGDLDTLWTLPNTGETRLFPDADTTGQQAFGDRELWASEGRELSTVARSGLFVDGLTENNLPHYTVLLVSAFGEIEETRPWINRWTAEEYRHSLAFDYYLLLSQWMNPVHFEQARKAQISDGQVPSPATAEDAFVYTSIQELATQISHRNHSKHLPNGTFKKLLGKIASEEGDHFSVYFDTARAVRDRFPDRFLVALSEQVKGFQMPGTGIEGFSRHAKVLSTAGVFDFTDIYNIYARLVGAEDGWDVEGIEPETPESVEAMGYLEKHIRRMRRASERLEEKRESSRTNGEMLTFRNPFPGYADDVEEIPPPRAKKIGEIALTPLEYQTVG